MNSKAYNKKQWALFLFKQDQMIIKKDGFQAEIRLFVFYIILYKLLDIHIVV